LADEPLRQFMARLVQALGLSQTYSPLGRLASLRAAEADGACASFVCSPDGSKALRAVRALRLEHNFRGAIYVLSFTPRERVVGWEWGEAIETAGCFYVRLPALAEELRDLLRGGVVLTDEEMSGVRKRLDARRIFRAASGVRHDYENKLSMALTHLRSLEKLSHFDEPDTGRLAREAAGLRESLSREKAEAFRSEVTALMAKAAEWRGGAPLRGPALLEAEWGEVEEWLRLSGTGVAEAVGAACETFARAKRLEVALRSILAAVLGLKEEARQVMSHAR
jgi:hypothetical protein